MHQGKVLFDHIHIISEDPHAAAAWYADKLRGEVIKSGEVSGAPQIYVAFSGGTIIVRGRRMGEEPENKSCRQWGVDHFGFHIEEDFDDFCDGLLKKGVTFTVEPKDFNPTTRIAFIEGPDGVNIELVHRTR
jgi:catechol 2,3-dioxygenase-like lactoylglutathione lyase family enzyme